MTDESIRRGAAASKGRWWRSKRSQAAVEQEQSGHPLVVTVAEEAEGHKWDPKGGEIFVLSLIHDIADADDVRRTPDETAELGMEVFRELSELRSSTRAPVDGSVAAAHVLENPKLRKALPFGSHPRRGRRWR